MKYRIKHENKVFPILGVIFIFATFILLVVNMQSMALFWAMITSLSLTGLTIILCIIDKIFGASIAINGKQITITRLFWRKKINAGDISLIYLEDIKRYRRKPEIHYEYRKKMTITLNSGKAIILTDNASEINGIIGFITGDRDRKSDEDIPLCQAYTEILKQRS